MISNARVAAEPRAELLREVQGRVDHYYKWDKRYYYIAQTILWAGMLASTLAALSSALGWDKNLTTILAILPAFAYAIEARLRFEDKSFFYFGYGNKLNAVRLDLEFTDAPIEEIVKRLKQIEGEMEYPRLGQDIKNRGEK
jgi:hypothetical protein